MPDTNPLNDSELKELEMRLRRVPVSPPPRECERLLYACGQAAGRAQMMRRVRNTTAVAALLGCTCAGLVALVVVREKSPPLAGINPAPPTAPQSAVWVPEQESPREARDVLVDRNRQLTVGAGFGELALAELSQKIVPPRESSPRLAAEPVLTTAGPLPVEL
jgi:hypothetical protein